MQIPIVMMTKTPSYPGHWVAIVLLVALFAVVAFLGNVVAKAWTDRGLAWERLGRFVLYGSVVIMGVIHLLWFVYPVAYRYDKNHPGFEKPTELENRQVTFPGDKESE